MKIKIYADTDKGHTRLLNQDAYGVFPMEQFYIVADGVGGQAGGEVAAVETVNQLFYGIRRLFKQLENCTQEEIQQLLKLNVNETNHIVLNKGAAHAHLRGMASTYCFLFIYAKQGYFSHYGDTRLYLLRDKTLKLLTKDHTVAQEIEDAQRVVTSVRQKNTLTKAIGLKTEQTPHVELTSIQAQDTFLICTDGLTEKLSKDDIQGYLLRNQPRNEVLKEMILDARNRSAKDNITAIILEIDDDK